MYAYVHHTIASRIDKHFGMLEERKLFEALLLVRVEVLLMGITKTCKYAYRRTYNLLQSTHFAWLGDGCLKDADLRLFVQVPYAQGYSNLAVIATRRTRDHIIRLKHLCQPFFHHRLAVRTRNADYRNAELATMVRHQSLQGFQGVVNYKEGGFWEFFLGQTTDHERTNAPLIELGYEIVSVTPSRDNRKEQAVLR